MLWQQTSLLAQTMSPQTEKACSDGTEVAGIARPTCTNWGIAVCFHTTISVD